MVDGSEGTSQYPEAPGLSELLGDLAPELLSCSSLSMSLEGEMYTGPWQTSLNPCGAHGLRGLQEIQPWAKKLVEHQPGQPGGGQPVDDPSLSWPARGDDDDA